MTGFSVLRQRANFDHNGEVGTARYDLLETQENPTVTLLRRPGTKGHLCPSSSRNVTLLFLVGDLLRFALADEASQRWRMVIAADRVPKYFEHFLKITGAEMQTEMPQVFVRGIGGRAKVGGTASCIPAATQISRFCRLVSRVGQSAQSATDMPVPSKVGEGTYAHRLGNFPERNLLFFGGSDGR